MQLDISQIKKDVERGRDIKISFLQNESAVNEIIKQTICTICEKYQKPDLSDALYGCVKELIINATKANLKRVFFLSRNWDIHNMGQYVMGLSKFKEMLEKNEYRNYLPLIQKWKLTVNLNIQHHSDGMVIEVVNNTAICEPENGRIRLKLKKAMVYDDIALYFNREQDNEEGAGMGIALIVILLKSKGLNPEFFRIGSKGDTTVARIEIPFNESFRAKRGLK